MSGLPREDLDHVVSLAVPAWEVLRGQRVLITGGTGFFGRWLIESLLAANRALGLQVAVVALTRDLARMRRSCPHLAEAGEVRWVEGDQGSFAWPEEPFSHVIHAATETDPGDAGMDRVTLLERNVAGTRRVLEFARARGVRRLLFTSSGAVYGVQPRDLPCIPEDYLGAPDPLAAGSAYGESKRVSEFMCAAAARAGGPEVVVARCFAFVGPLLPLDRNYAIGNFIADALKGGPIQVMGDGTPMRSYLYAADLAAWLWILLARGRSCQAYNVGSDQALSIADLARCVAAEVDPALRVSIAKPAERSVAPARYIPSITRVRGELGLEPCFDLCHSIRKTASWYGRCV